MSLVLLAVAAAAGSSAQRHGPQRQQRQQQQCDPANPSAMLQLGGGLYYQCGLILSNRCADGWYEHISTETAADETVAKANYTCWARSEDTSARRTTGCPRISLTHCLWLTDGTAGDDDSLKSRLMAIAGWNFSVGQPGGGGRGSTVGLPLHVRGFTGRIDSSLAVTHVSTRGCPAFS